MLKSSRERFWCKWCEWDGLRAVGKQPELPCSVYMPPSSPSLLVRLGQAGQTPLKTRTCFRSSSLVALVPPLLSFSLEPLFLLLPLTFRLPAAPCGCCGEILLSASAKLFGTSDGCYFFFCPRSNFSRCDLILQFLTRVCACLDLWCQRNDFTSFLWSSSLRKKFLLANWSLLPLLENILVNILLLSLAAGILVKSCNNRRNGIFTQSNNSPFLDGIHADAGKHPMVPGPILQSGLAPS